MVASTLGKVAAGVVGVAAAGVTVVSVPFLTPALRRICIPYVPATPNQIANVLAALSHCPKPLEPIVDLGSGDGRVLSGHLTPEWRKQYINYAELKSMLYSIVEGAPALDDERMRDTYFARLDEEFFSMCEAELTKINLFFCQKLAEAQGKFHELVRDLDSLKQLSRGRGASFRKTLSTAHLISPLRILRKDTEQQNLMETQAKTQHQLKLAFSEYYLGLVLIQNFQSLNGTGFRKILKKRDKLLDDSKGLEWRQKNVEKSAFFLNREIETLISKTEETFIHDLEAGDRSTGMKRLRVPPLSEKQHAWTTFRLGLYLGCFLVLLFLIIITLAHSWQRKDEPKWVGVRLFRGFLVLFVNIWLVGLNMYGWQGAGVNHVLIFEINPREHLTYQNLMELASFFMMIWAFAVLGYLYAESLNCSPFLFPLILMFTCIFWLINPIKKPMDCMRKSSRYWLIQHLFYCFTAPFHYVSFPDFWMADQMNSLVTFFLDMEYFVCFYAAEVQWTESANSTMLTIITSVEKDGGVEAVTGQDFCSSNSLGIRPVVSLLPALIRFLQCLRRFRDTKQRHPHLTNAGKYATTFFVVFFGALNTWYQATYSFNSVRSPFFYMWIIAYIVSYLYTFSWDLFMDWGLAQRKHKFLREELVYSKRWFYYLAMFQDGLLRLAWVLNVSLGDAWTLDAEILMCITAPLECFRRFIWNFFRLENEHLNNCGQFRAIRDISVKPIKAGDVDDLIKKVDDDDGVTHRGDELRKDLLKKKRGRFKKKSGERGTGKIGMQLRKTFARKISKNDVVELSPVQASPVYSGTVDTTHWEG